MKKFYSIRIGILALFFTCLSVGQIFGQATDGVCTPATTVDAITDAPADVCENDLANLPAFSGANGSLPDASYVVEVNGVIDVINATGIPTATLVAGDVVCVTAFAYDLAAINGLLETANGFCPFLDGIIGAPVCGPIGDLIAGNNDGNPGLNNLQEALDFAGSFGAPITSVGDAVTTLTDLNGQLGGFGLPSICFATSAAVCYTILPATDPACATAVPGCNDPTACNFDPAATEDDGSCVFETACDDGDCTNGVEVWNATTCMCDPGTPPTPCTDDGDCTNGFEAWDATNCVCDVTAPVLGCTDMAADNYDPLADCDDNSCTSTSGACGACAGAGGLFITELNWNPDDNVNGTDFDCEYIEIFNGYSTPVSLDGVIIRNGLDFDFPPGFTIAPGEYILVVWDPTDFGNCVWPTGVPVGTQIFGPFTSGNLGNSNPETLTLTLTCANDGTQAVTMVTYGGVIGDGDGNSVNYNLSTGAEYSAAPTPGSGDCAGCTGAGSAYECGPTDVPGCMDMCSANFDPAATVDDGSCTAQLLGCTDPAADNYDPTALCDDNSCVTTVDIMGCTNPCSANYNPAATVDDGTCSAELNGCTNPSADNYDPSALCDDGSCILTCNPFITTFPANGGGGN